MRHGSVSQRTGEIFLIGHLLHPSHGRAVDGLLDGNVGHSLMRRRAMPVPVFCRAPKNVARVELQFRTAINLRPADTFGHDQRLSRWMRVPRRARSRFEVDDCSAYAGWLGPLKLAGDCRPSCEILGWSINRLHVGLACNIHSRT